MARLDVNRSGEMEVFVRVVAAGGFSAAARDAGMTPSAVSRLVARLEARLGARLVNRSTRRLQLTAEGLAFHARALRVLADLEEAERAAGAGVRPAGPVRINTSASYGNHVLGPLLPGLMAAWPEITFDIVQTDRVVDLLAERADIAIRGGPMKSSALLARRLGETAQMIVGSPAYLARHGTPRTPEELHRHVRLGFGYQRALEGWPLKGLAELLPTGDRVRASDGHGLQQLVLAGVGLARLSVFTLAADLAAGRLLPVLEAFNPGDREPFHAVHLGQGGPLPARIRVVLDHLAQHGRVDRIPATRT
jgi:DNA-binding transcriptional LysR family regulator